MRKLVIALTLAAATALPMVLQSTSADAYPVCRIGGHFYQMRCPDRVAARGIDGRAHWSRLLHVSERCLQTLGTLLT